MYKKSSDAPLRISVIIPAYNRATTIGRALASVLSQTYPALEVIVVDDGSQDNTREVISSVNDPRLVSLIQSTNSGAQAARNRGIKHARGDWIAFLDSDDEWKPEKLERQVQALRGVAFDPWVVVHTNGLVVRENGKKKNFRVPPVSGEASLYQLLSAPGPMFQGMLASKRALQAAGYLDENVPSYQEWDTAILLAKNCRFLYLDEPLFLYYHHQGPTISKDRQRDLVGYDYVIGKHEAEIVERLGEAGLRKHLRLQTLRALDFGFWDASQRYIDRLNGLNENTLRLVALYFLRWGRIPPRVFSPLRRAISFSLQRIRPGIAARTPRS